MFLVKNAILFLFEVHKLKKNLKQNKSNTYKLIHIILTYKGTKYGANKSDEETCFSAIT